MEFGSMNQVLVEALEQFFLPVWHGECHTRTLLQSYEEHQPHQDPNPQFVLQKSTRRAKLITRIFDDEDNFASKSEEYWSRYAETHVIRQKLEREEANLRNLGPLPYREAGSVEQLIDVVDHTWLRTMEVLLRSSERGQFPSIMNERLFEPVLTDEAELCCGTDWTFVYAPAPRKRYSPQPSFTGMLIMVVTPWFLDDLLMVDFVWEYNINRWDARPMNPRIQVLWHMLHDACEAQGCSMFAVTNHSSWVFGEWREAKSQREAYVSLPVSAGLQHFDAMNFASCYVRKEMIRTSPRPAAVAKLFFLWLQRSRGTLRRASFIGSN